MGQEHPLIAALDKAQEDTGEPSYADKLAAAAGAQPWTANAASWTALKHQTDPNHLEVTEEAVKCSRLDQDTDIIDNRVYINGEGKPVMSRLLAIQQQVEDAQNNPAPGIHPQDVESILSIIVGLLVAVVAISLIMYLGLNFIYKNDVGHTASELFNTWVATMKRWICGTPKTA
jgi:hypothetical protein